MNGVAGASAPGAALGDEAERGSQVRKVVISVHREAGTELAVAALHSGVYPGHLHTTAEFLLQLHGPGFAYVRGLPIALEPGDLLAILPNEVHARSPGVLVQFAALEIDPAALARHTGVELPATLAPADGARLWRGALAPAEVRALERDVRDDLSGAAVRARRFLLERMLGHPLLRRRRHPGAGRSGLTHDVLRQVGIDFDSALDMERLRSISGFNGHYFISAFRESFGLPPHQVLLGRRLDRARAAVIATDTKLADIAADHGFYDQSHLCRVFKRAWALSPLEYRQSVRVYAAAPSTGATAPG